MSQIKIRVYREGQWQYIQVEDGTNEEIECFFSTFSKERLVSWLTYFIKKSENKLNTED